MGDFFPGASYDRWKTREEPSADFCPECGEELQPDEKDERSRPGHPVMYCPNRDCSESPRHEEQTKEEHVGRLRPVREADDSPRRRGAQTRDTLEEADYLILDGPVGKKGERRVLTKDRATGRQELWKENDNFLGYVMDIEGTGYQFVRSVPKNVSHISQISESVITEKVKCDSDREAVEQAMQLNGTAVNVNGVYMVMSKEELAALEKSGVEFAYLYAHEYANSERVVSIPNTARWVNRPVTKAPEQTPPVQAAPAPAPSAPPAAPVQNSAPAAPAAPARQESKLQTYMRRRTLGEAKSMNRSMEELKDDVFEIGGWEVNDKAWDEGAWLGQVAEAIVANRKNDGVMGRAIYAVPSRKEVMDVMARLGVL